MTKQELGRAGEDAACGYLLSKGYEILERNYRSRCGEVDIIAKDGGTLVFAEVKLRAERSAVSGREAVNAAKMRRLVRTAALWIESRESLLPARFDVIEVLAKGANTGEICGIRHIISAFDTEVCGEVF